MPDAFSYITDAPDYRHLVDRERYKALYEEVGLVEANRTVRWREEWMKYFQPAPGSAILELGAHNGPNLIHYARRGHLVDGVEISSTLIETFGRSRNLEPPDVETRMRMFPGWIEDFQPPRTYDYVLCTEILEHVPDPVAVLRTARRALAPAGLVYITSPSTHWGNNTHVRGVAPDDLRAWLADAGLAPDSIFVENERTFALASRSS